MSKSVILPSSRGCRRACKSSDTSGCADCGCCQKQQCPGRPKVIPFHQGIVMSGAGLPPNTVGGVLEPDPKCFLYRTWYDFSADNLYVLTTDLQGKANGYDCFANGSQLLLQNKINDTSNPARLGSVLAGATIFNLQRCLNSESANFQGQARTSVDNTQRVLNCAIAKANRGSISFVYGNPPVPVVLDALAQNAGYVNNPDFWLVPGTVAGEVDPANGFQDFGWQVFVRDKSVNRYYRDSFNSPMTDPMFPENPCDGDLYPATDADALADTFGLIYEYSSDKCRWYLFDAATSVVDALANSLDPINAGLEPLAGSVPLEDDWERDCRCDAPSAGCGCA